VTSCAQEDTVRPERCDMVGRCYFRMGSAPRVLLSPFQVSGLCNQAPIFRTTRGKTLFLSAQCERMSQLSFAGVPFLFRDRRQYMDEK